MKIFADKRMLRSGLIGGTLSRHSGNMRNPDVQQVALQQLGIDPAHILHFRQTHSDSIISIKSDTDAQVCQQQPLREADAWVLSPCPTGWGAAIVTADCVPLFIWDDAANHIALAHCGWRGVVKKLASKTVQTLLKHAPNLHLNAWIGPHIQACCFEVQEDVRTQFPEDCMVYKNGKMFVDLNVELKRQLMQAGVAAQDIHAPYYCTCGDRTNFFSWRRDHQKNLLLSFIYKP